MCVQQQQINLKNNSYPQSILGSQTEHFFNPTCRQTTLDINLRLHFITYAAEARVLRENVCMASLLLPSDFWRPWENENEFPLNR
jgi:hypothetical protein